MARSKALPRRYARHAAAVAVAVATLLLAAFDAARAMMTASAFAAPTAGDARPQRQLSAGAGETLNSQPRTLVAMAATQVKKKGKKKSVQPVADKPGKYRGVVNPSLRAFLASKQYRDLVVLLAQLKDDGGLDEFLEKADDYWIKADIFQLAEKERQKASGGVLASVRKDWPKIWPAGKGAEQSIAFDKFADFWKRLDSSKLIDKVMSEVLPDMDKKPDEKAEASDTAMLKKMSDEERSAEILRRLGQVEIIVQFAALSQGDKEIQSIGSKMGPFIARFVSILEKKVATQTEALGKTTDNLFILLGVVVVFLIALFSGALNSIINFELPKS